MLKNKWQTEPPCHKEDSSRIEFVIAERNWTFQIFLGFYLEMSSDMLFALSSHFSASTLAEVYFGVFPKIYRSMVYRRIDVRK